LIKPSKDATDAVYEWLEYHGITGDQLKSSPAGDWLSLTLPVSKVERMLDTEYSVYEHLDGSTLVRTEGYSLPLYLHQHITTIQPTNSWARLEGRKQRKEVVKRGKIEKRASHASVVSDDWAPPPLIPLPNNATIASVCNFTAVTPDCVRTLYGTLDYQVKSAGVNKIAHTNYLEEQTNRSDVSIFLGKYRPEAQAAAYEFEAVSIAGGLVDNGTNVAAEGWDREANLDAEYILGISWPTPLIAYSTAGRNPTYMPDTLTVENTDEPFLVWANYITSQEDIPQVISTSYGDNEQTVSRAYAQAVCNQFAQLGARGVSLFFSSGDAGVGQDETCISNLDNTTYMFMPSFPASCPYVTTVGATTNYPESAAWRKLSSGSYFTSGAGFSNYFDQPAYQSKAVDGYVSSLDGLYDGFYNKSGKLSHDIRLSFLANVVYRTSISRHFLRRTSIPDDMEWQHTRASGHIGIFTHLCLGVHSLE
jgi:tripeptidyl-peptidase-1